MLVDVKATITESNRWKPGGCQFDDVSAKLSLLWDDRAGTLTYNTMRGLGIGNPKQTRPFQASLTRRIVDAMSVVYSVPAVRTLNIDGKELGEDTAGFDAMRQAFQASAYDLLWQGIDALRNLYRTAVVEWIEDPAAKAVTAQVFGPHCVHRIPDPLAPSSFERSSAVLLLVHETGEPKDRRYRAWLRQPDDTWRVAVVDADGNCVGPQPYEGNQLTGAASPFGAVLPLQLVTDEHPLGAAWLPIPESRVTWALGVNGLLNDLAYLVQLEAHTIKSVRDATGTPPAEIGPDSIIHLRDDTAEVRAISQSPKISESVRVIEQHLSLWALSEYLSPDEFQPSAVPMNGMALKVKERALAKRRWRQIQLVPTQEQAAWRIYARVHNTFARQWGREPLAEDALMRVSVGRTWQPADPRELQDYLFRLLACGFKSRVDVAMELEGLTRDQAITHLERVRLDNDRFPLTEYQNPGSLADARGAGGQGSATKTPGMLNPDLTTSTNGASVVSAVQQATAPKPA